jgi:membrane protein DedA with SNARE-associated domain
MALIYAAISTVASVLGATLDYFIGRLGGRPLADRFVGDERVESAEEFFRDHGGWTIGIVAFTPLPYPIFALAAGVARLGLWRFVIASLAGRGARFFGIGLAIFFFGPAIQRFLEEYLGLATVIAGALLVAGYAASRYSSRRFEGRSRGRD